MVPFPTLWILFATIVIPNAVPKVREVFHSEEEGEAALHHHEGEVGVGYDLVKYTPINPLDMSHVV